MKIFLFILNFIAFINALDLETTSNDGKYFEVILDRFEVVSEDTSVAEFNIKVRKINKIRAVIGFINIHEPVGNDVSVEIKTLKKQGGEYRYMPYSVPPSPFCNSVANDPYCWPQVAKDSDFPEDMKTNCPLVPKNYSINGVTCDMKDIPKVVSSGDYGAEIIYSRGDNVISIYRIYGSINYV